MTVPPPERFAGAIVGQALGDALGFPLEGHPGSLARRYVDEVLRAGRAGEIARAPFPFGQYTDDTQLARELMISIADTGRLDPGDFGRRVGAIFTDGRIVGRGRSTEAAALRLAAGVPWDEAGTPAPSAGNGSAMRAAPVGLVFAHDAAALSRAAHDQGRVTHADPRCSAGAVAIATAAGVAGNASAETFDLGALLDQAAELAAPFDTVLAGALTKMKAWRALPPDAAFARIAPVGAGADAGPGYGEAWDGISPFVTPSVLWSIYAFVRSPADYWETICTAIAVGGDVDTTAAMAGAMSGALNGLDAVPADLARRLTDRGSWTHADLVALAGRCHGVAEGLLGDSA